MNATEVTKIQVPPELHAAKARVEAAAARAGVLYQTIGWRTRLKLFAGRLIHPLRIHTWTTWRTYDPASDRILDTGGQICEFCPAAKLP